MYSYNKNVGELRITGYIKKPQFAVTRISSIFCNKEHAGMDERKEKAAAILVSLQNTAEQIIQIAKSFPKQKHRKNIFVKTYNRRPNNKGKSALLKNQLFTTAFMGAVDVQRINQMPIPKYRNGISSQGALIGIADEIVFGKTGEKYPINHEKR